MGASMNSLAIHRIFDRAPPRHHARMTPASVRGQDAAAVKTSIPDAVSGAIAHEDLARAQRFADSALPHLDTVYTFARYLLRDPTNAEDAVQECYLRALRHFDTLRSPDIKPWLLTILHNVCRVEFGRRSRLLSYDVNAESDNSEAAIPLWQEAHATLEIEVLRKLEAERSGDCWLRFPTLSAR